MASHSTGSDARDRDRSLARECSGVDGPPCPRCETPLYERHCEYVCPNHGVIYDCADPFC